MGDRRCCCIGDCIIFTDDFEREEIGANWDIIAGDWDIVDGHLVTEDENAEIESTTRGPKNEEDVFAFIVRVRLKPEAKGDQLYVRIDRRYRIVVHNGDADNVTSLRLYDDDGGATLLGTYSHNDHSDMTLTVCVSSQWITATFATEPDPDDGLSAPVEITDGYIGLGTIGLDAASTARFDDFEIEKGFEVDPDCPPCVPFCQYVHWPDKLEDGQTLYTADWTGAGDWTIAQDLAFGVWAEFDGAGTIMWNGVDPHEENAFFHVRVTFDTGTVEDSVTRIYFGGANNYIQLSWNAAAGYDVDVQPYLGGVAEGASKNRTSAATQVMWGVCVTPVNVVIYYIEGAGAPSPFLSIPYIPASSAIGVGVESIDAAEPRMRLNAFVSHDVQEGCPYCGGICNGCEDGTYNYTRFVEIDGTADNTCDNCGVFDGLFEVISDPAETPGDCYWFHEEEIVVCGKTVTLKIEHKIEPGFDVVPDGVEATVRIFLLEGAVTLNEVVYLKKYDAGSPDAELNCLTFSDDLPRTFTDGTFCTFPATIHVSGVGS